jgi:glyoxylase I family protein
MEEAGFSGIGHLDLSVSDVEASAAWYEKVLGLRRLRREAFPERTMIVLRHDASGLVVGLNQHQGFPGEPFDERRAGLDHVGFAVGRRQDLDVWQGRLAALGVEHSPVADTEVGSALVFRDPDHIQLELWWSKPAGDAPTAHPVDRGVIERSSPLRVDETVRRLADAVTAAGATVFATIDHAAGARSVGLEMPETQVVIVGNPAAGTPPMLAAPDLALELPTRLLVRQASPGAPGSTVVFSDPTALAHRYGLSSEQVAGLAGVVSLVDRALGRASDA